MQGRVAHSLLFSLGRFNDFMCEMFPCIKRRCNADGPGAQPGPEHLQFLKVNEITPQKSSVRRRLSLQGPKAVGARADAASSPQPSCRCAGSSSWQDVPSGGVGSRAQLGSCAGSFPEYLGLFPRDRIHLPWAGTQQMGSLMQ